MKFNEIYFSHESGDVLLIQPNMLQPTLPEHIDPVQTEYWNCCDRVGSLLGDLPIEPNWGLLSIASNLLQNGYKVSHIDFHLYDYIKVKRKNEFINEEDIFNVLSKKEFKVVGISAMTLSHKNALNIARVCKQVNPNCKVILGGIHFSFLPEEALQYDYVDGVLCGEGELSFLELMSALNTGDSWDSIPGLLCRNQDPTKKTPARLIKDLDTLPFPAYSLWPEDIPLIPRIYTARGCNGGCDYCVVNQFFYGKYRRRSIANVIEELKYIKELGCDEILVGDLNLGASKLDVINLCNYIIENKMNIRWWCQTRACDLDEELIDIMSNAGCVQVGIGIESADEIILQKASSNKSHMSLSIKELCSLIKKYGMEVQGYFIIGLPGETMNSALKTIACIDDLTKNGFVDISHIAILVPYPGTPIFENPQAFDVQIVHKDFSKYIMNCDYMNTGLPVVRTNELSEYQIYSLWQLALSTAANNFKKRLNDKCNNLFDDVSFFWQEINLFN